MCSYFSFFFFFIHCLFFVCRLIYVKFLYANYLNWRHVYHLGFFSCFVQIYYKQRWWISDMRAGNLHWPRSSVAFLRSIDFNGSTLAISLELPRLVFYFVLALYVLHKFSLDFSSVSHYFRMILTALIANTRTWISDQKGGAKLYLYWMRYVRFDDRLFFANFSSRIFVVIDLLSTVIQIHWPWAERCGLEWAHTYLSLIVSSK